MIELINQPKRCQFRVDSKQIDQKAVGRTPRAPKARQPSREPKKRPSKTRKSPNRQSHPSDCKCDSCLRKRADLRAASRYADRPSKANLARRRKSERQSFPIGGLVFFLSAIVLIAFLWIYLDDSETSKQQTQQDPVSSLLPTAILPTVEIELATAIPSTVEIELATAVPSTVEIELATAVPSTVEL